MKAESANDESLSPEVAVPAPSTWSALDLWYRRPRQRAPGTRARLTAEECYRVIELAAQRQTVRRRITPEFNLRDWLDAEEEVKSH